MISPISKAELRGIGRFARSELSAFAEDALREFEATSGPGDVAEVTGWPSPDGCDPVRAAEKAAAAIRTEAFYLGVRERIRVTRRKERVFVERTDRR